MEAVNSTCAQSLLLESISPLTTPKQWEQESESNRSTEPKAELNPRARFLTQSGEEGCHCRGDSGMRGQVGRYMDI
mgnify:CR=1 FL=1